MNKKAILYIIGTGRSGTTLVDILLGNDDQMFSGGELNRLPKRAGIAPGRKKGDKAYSFWNIISEKLSNQFSLEMIFRLSENIEYHSGFFHRKRRFDKHYQLYLKEFFALIFDAIGEDILIDSSKYPMRAYHLANEFPEEFRYCIYVKKHPISVLRSFQKKGLEQPPKNWMIVNIYLVTVHLLSSFVVNKLRKSGVKVYEVNFEDVVNSPIVFVNNIERAFDLNLSDLKEKLEVGLPLKTNMLFDGNRIRLKKEVKILSNKPPSDWKLLEHFVYFCNKFWWKTKNK
ncbi:MAG: sulfotransferase [Cyclobacteriaceae bacterium]